MKALKIIGLTLLGIVAISLLAAAFMKKEYLIEREITINKPRQEVFDYIKMIKNQDNFSKWNKADPAMKKEFSGTDGTVGFIYKWDGNDEVGAGEQEITKITDGERIDLDLRFKRPFENNVKTYFATETVSATSTKVTWAMYGESSYPMNLLNGMMEGMLGDDLETSLNDLKTQLEKR